MSNSTKFFIAFCEENRNIAEEINQKLKRVGFKFDLLGSNAIKENSNLVNLMTKQNKPGLLLISDNYLKSEICMERMLDFINNLNESSSILPIITDGRYPSNSGKGFENIPTAFDRVSNVIKYMNYWQELYLDLRKEKRSIPAAEAAEFEIKLEKVKSISSSIGDFLRILRTKRHLAFYDLEKNDFELFFKTFSDDNSYKKYQSLAANDPKKKNPTDQTPPSDKSKNETLKEAAEKEIVIPVFEEKVAEIDVNTVENMAQQVAEEDLSPALDKTPSEPISVAGTKMQVSNNPTKAKKDQSSFSPAFEQQVDQLVEEIQQEEVHTATENDDQINPAFENDDDMVLEDVFEDDEAEDITSDFDVMMAPEIEAEPKDQKEDASALNEVDQMIFDASNLIESGKIDEAISILNDVLKQHPKNNGARYMYAMILFNYQEDYENAYAQLQKVVELDPQNAEAFEHLGKISEINNDFLLAKKYYEKVASLKPHTFGIYYKLGLITSGFLKDKKKKAFKYFKKAIKQDDQNIDAHYRLGLLLNEAFQKPKKAVKHFKKVLKLDPQHQFANYDLAILYNGLGNHRKAAKYYKRAHQINPEFKTPENDIVFSLDENISINPEESFSVSPKDQNDITTSETTENEQVTNQNSDKVVFVTGATSGIGKATAALFASNGFRLILNGRRKERLIDLQKEFDNLYQTNSIILPFDVRNIDDVKKAIEELDAEWSQVDILINNAGLAKGYAPIHEGNLDHWETMIDTNIKGLLYLTRAIAPHMVKRQSGQIINVCSSAGHEVYPNGNVYCATKFAVDALTKGMRLDLHKHNIRVGQVSPGHVEETEFALVRYEDEEKAKVYEDFQPLKSKDVAEVIYFMVSAPPHVNIQDVQMMGTQQASNIFIDRSGK